MRKFLLLLSAVTFLSLILTSCEKNTAGLHPDKREMITLTASTESAPKTKTLLGGDNMTQVHWRPIDASIDNDKIAICDDSGNTETHTIVSIDPEDSRSATFRGTKPDGNAVSAIYPASIASANNIVSLGATQDYTFGNVKNGTMPMYAQLSDYTSTMSFKNLCGILKLQLMKAQGESEDVKVTKIEITSENNLTGLATIAYNGGNPTLAISGTPGKTITLNCGESGVALADYYARGIGATVFYIAVPPTQANTFTIKVTTDDGKTMTKTALANAANQIIRNKITTMPALEFIEDTPKAQVGDYYYSDGTWSSNLKEEKTVIGLVFWTGNPSTPSANESGLTFPGDPKLAADHPSCVNGLVIALRDIADETSVWQTNAADVPLWLTNNVPFDEYITIKAESSGNPLNQIARYNNTKAIEIFNDDETNSGNKVDALEKIVAYRSSVPAPPSSSGWYLPSIKELTMLCGTSFPNNNIWDDDYGTDNRDALNTILTSLNSKGATEIANNNYWSSTKYGTIYVLAVDINDGTIHNTDKNNEYNIRPILAF